MPFHCIPTACAQNCSLAKADEKCRRRSASEYVGIGTHQCAICRAAQRVGDHQSGDQVAVKGLGLFLMGYATQRQASAKE
jgi:hypothetical protein